MLNAVRPLVRGARKIVAKSKLRSLPSNGFPQTALPAATYLVSEKADDRAEKIADRIEAERDRLASFGSQKVDILYSPKPGSAGSTVTADLRPSHGEVMQFSMEQVARTGKTRRWGLFMHLLAREHRSANILELGTCAGISGSYIGSSPHCGQLRTIEGSPALAELARSVLPLTVKNPTVINALFDDALDDILPTIDPIDFLFIDGHHEKIATIHYWQRIRPKLSDGAVVVFDDISWSQDMRDGWNELVREPHFSDAMDFGIVGVCIYRKDGSKPPRKWDLRAIAGVSKAVGNPHGWREAAAAA
ncbi:class I SAM-dependent methyltransferase [Mesorhizobium sp. M1312]|uniref:O-methyltransferase n=1 Tax=unclassified Mesorhizobium TaxID=325217 RepID=UPI003339560D